MRKKEQKTKIRERYLKNRANPKYVEAKRARDREYYALHKEENKAYRKEYDIKCNADPEYKKRRLANKRMSNKKYRAEHCEFVKNHNTYVRNWRKTLKGKEIIKRNSTKRRQLFDYNPLNPIFQGCAGHHIDKINVINIPNELHKSIWHKQTNNDQMKQINIAAWSFMESQSY